MFAEASGLLPATQYSTSQFGKHISRFKLRICHTVSCTVLSLYSTSTLTRSMVSLFTPDDDPGLEQDMSETSAPDTLDPVRVILTLYYDHWHRRVSC
jgi:hypothetical protein